MTEERTDPQSYFYYNNLVNIPENGSIAVHYDQDALKAYFLKTTSFPKRFAFKAPQNGGRSWSLTTTWTGRFSTSTRRNSLTN